MNQKLAVKILEKCGHKVEIVENGLLVVDAFKVRVVQGRPFEILLVGGHLFLLFSEMIAGLVVQMNISTLFMGGMEATELIHIFKQHINVKPLNIFLECMYDNTGYSSCATCSLAPKCRSSLISSTHTDNLTLLQK